MEIRREEKELKAERKELKALIASPELQRARLRDDLTKMRALYGPETELGRRRTSFAEAGPAREIPPEAMIEKEPIKVILSAKGWVREMKGHIDLGSADEVQFKEGDGPALAFPGRESLGEGKGWQGRLDTGS